MGGKKKKQEPQTAETELTQSIKVDTSLNRAYNQSKEYTSCAGHQERRKHRQRRIRRQRKPPATRSDHIQDRGYDLLKTALEDN